MNKTLVIVGAGTGGLSIAGAISTSKARKRLDIVIIDPSTKHYYQPQWTMVGAGMFPKEKTQKLTKDLIPKNVSWRQESVTSVDPIKKTINLSVTGTMPYDYLIVASGLKLDWDKISGLSAAMGKNGVCSNFSYQTVDATWDAVRSIKKGSAIFTFPPPPIKCAGAPQKVMYLAEHYFRKTSVRREIDVRYFCAGDSIFAVKKYAETLNRICEDRDIDTQFGWNLTEVIGKSNQAVFTNTHTGETRCEKYGLLHVTPPMSAPAFIQDSNIGNDSGFVNVDPRSLQHIIHPDIFSIGDSSSLPTSKTAAAIRAQVPVLKNNFLAHIEGEELDAEYDGYTSCPLVTGYNSLILAEFNYQLEPLETFPFNQAKERLSMYLLKKYLMPILYWKALIRGKRWPNLF
jgi:sulfide:quinone oxidoreductase